MIEVHAFPKPNALPINIHDLASTGSIWLPLTLGWLEKRPGWLELGALCAPGRPGWVDLGASECPNDCPNDTISKKIDLLIDDPASTLPASFALDRFVMPQI